MINFQKHFKVLELDKILLSLSKECNCKDAAEMATLIVPSTSLYEVNTLLRETEDAYILIARFGSPSFWGLQNINNALARAEAGGTLSMDELLNIASVLQSIRTLIEWRSHSAAVKTVLDELFLMMAPNKYLEEKIRNAIISAEEMSDNASPALYDIRRKIRATSTRVREQLDKFIKSKTHQKYLQDQVITQRGGRFVVPIKSEFRGEVSGLVHDTSSSGATVFIEPMAVVEANNEVRVLISKEEAEIDRILMELSAEAGSFSGSIKDSYTIAVELNLIFAKAKLAYNMKASVPIINDSGKIFLKKARHPLLAASSVVPVDISLGEEFDTLVVTGPNTGGKTVILKTLGLLTLMAMCGLMLPVYDNSRISIFDAVLADIGDEQSIEQSLSTFSSHIKNIIDILETANQKTLVLLDELGAGTDPVEGAALSVAILENLRTKKAKIAATTHYAELKAFALETVGVENGSCEFDVATLRPTYKLLIGVPGRSNAFAISEKLGIKKDVVDRARMLVSTENSKFENVVKALEETRKNLESERVETEKLKKIAEDTAFAAEAKAATLEKEYAIQIENAKAQARGIVEATRAETNKLLNELEDIKKHDSSESLKQAKAAIKSGFEKIENAADPVANKKVEEYSLPRPLKVGDTVLIRDIDKKGTVLSLPDSKGDVLVLAGIIKTKVALNNLKLLMNENTNKPKPVSRAVGLESRTLRTVATELDIRGMDGLEGIMMLEGFIDNAVMNNITVFTVIHGKGTGALRTAVQNALRHNKAVRTYRPGVFGEGEAGVTIVELK